MANEWDLLIEQSKENLKDKPHKNITKKLSKNIESLLTSDKAKFFDKLFSPVIENLWVPGYYFDRDMIEKLFSNEWLTMIDFKKTLYHKSIFLWQECMELDEESYWENEKHTYNAKINEWTKTIEIYIDWWNNWEPNYSIKYDEKPSEDEFNLFRRLNTLYIQNKNYEYACWQIKSSRHLSLYFRDRERSRRYDENIDENFDVLKDIDHTIKMKDEKYKDFMLQLTEFTHLGKGGVSMLYYCISDKYYNGTIEKKREMDELAKKKIKLFENFSSHGTHFWAWVYEEMKWVRPYIALKYLELKAKRSSDYVLQDLAKYIGSIEPEDMDPNDERIKEVNLCRWAFVDWFMAWH